MELGEHHQHVGQTILTMYHADFRARLWVDQPVGAGYVHNHVYPDTSLIRPSFSVGKVNATGEIDIAAQFGEA
jgi:hypothetical protein